TIKAVASGMAVPMRQRLADAALSRVMRQSKALNGYAVQAVRTPMRDGVVLLGDHFAPATATPKGTILIRTPYGRGFPTSALNGRLFAARGYHVLIQSVRGTFGSGGTFRAMAQETVDGLDTVAWLRTQAWFDGRLATLGASYLGWTQWTLMQDPPPELRTAVVYVGPHDFRRAVFGTGAFTLMDFLGWSDQVAHQEDGGVRRVLSMATAARRVRPALGGLPLPAAAEPLLRGRAPWYAEWLAHPDGDDPWWAPYRADAALDRVNVPVLLVAGWQDLFLEQSLEQYEALRTRGVDVALTVGPWTHFEVAGKAAGQVARESMAWLDQHMAGGRPARRTPVRVFRTGERKWHGLATWPPPATPATFRLHPDRTLTIADPPPATLTLPATSRESAEAAAEIIAAAQVDAAPTDGGPGEPSGAEVGPADGEAGGRSGVGVGPADESVSFRYDPRDPTPGVGGRTLAGAPGVKDNRALEARPDVLTFTTDPLPSAVDVIGSPTVELAITVDQPYADVFLRLCDVDTHGQSRNFSDLLHRLDPTAPPGVPQHLSLNLDSCFHRLPAGHRLRLQISGGAFPRYARNLGTPGTPADGRTLRPSVHTVRCDESRLILPVATPA
ncbi:MAG TPA: CocE/NonD family hydrolase, partial [Actinoplanes sp.]